MLLKSTIAKRPFFGNKSRLAVKLGARNVSRGNRSIVFGHASGNLGNLAWRSDG
jgi:hypothetical protein